jgi:hypothetical protein
MDKTSQKTKLKMETSAHYRIMVQGYIDQRWSGRLGGLEITNVTGAEPFLVTQLSGELIDQAALMGVLNTLYDLQLPLLAVIGLDSFSDLAPALESKK